MAACFELRQDWLPARLEQVYQRDRHTLALALRTLKHRRWLTLSWHPQASRICLGDPPPRTPDTFTFSQQLQHQIGGFALVAIEAIAPWERVVDLQFARRPGDPIQWHLYAEVMTKYSNVILVNQEGTIVTAAHQVSAQQSSVRPIQTGEGYTHPPSLTSTMPSLQESQDRWQERLTLIPGSIKRNLLKQYRGLSPALVDSMLLALGLELDQTTDQLTSADWTSLFEHWQLWLSAIEHFQTSGPSPFPKPGWRTQGYTVMGWGVIEPAASVQTLLNQYYIGHLNHQEFQQLHQQLTQKLNTLLTKLRQKLTTFQNRLHESEAADLYRQQADLLMAYLHQWQPGLSTLTLPDFETSAPVAIALEPEKNAVQNAQALYKRHQKLKRARTAVEPLLQATQEEVNYLEQVEVAIAQLSYHAPEDLLALEEIRDELVQQAYFPPPTYVRRPPSRKAEEPESQPYHYHSPNGFEIWVGRNNRQNDLLTFRWATDYDLWFHTQEIPGSHVLLRLNAGDAPTEADLQWAADLAAFFSRARQGDQVPVVYTEPRHIFKPKGAKPGLVVYKKERILWGQPQRAVSAIPLTLK
jgi:predicted ribosome quality control (RQC) complex YloA/Tae2 family protein